jgi:hypothetical protein
MAVCYTLAGETKPATPSNRTRFTQEELRGYLGEGEIEFLPGKQGHLFARNKEGQEEHLPFNIQATAVAHQFYPDVAFYGNVLELSFEEAGISIGFS